MDKVTRILFLYSKLSKGEEINKTIYCFEHDCSARTFDRDIEDIRLFLSEGYSPHELIYDRTRNVYFIEGAKKSELEWAEYLFIERILRDTAVLREDEFTVLLEHLQSNTENTYGLKFQTREPGSYKSPSHNRALLKIYADLVSVLTKDKIIRITYLEQNGKETEQDVVPCSVKYNGRYLYLSRYRYDTNEQYPIHFRLDRICSFCIVGDQNYNVREKVRRYSENNTDYFVERNGGE